MRSVLLASTFTDVPMFMSLILKLDLCSTYLLLTDNFFILFHFLKGTTHDL